MSVLKEKTVLITGASRGLGAQLAKEFWLQGANLILVARSFEKLTELHQQLIAKPTHSQQHIKLIIKNLESAAELTTLIAELEHGEPIDILINNAAIQGPIGPVWENDWQQWQNTLQVNLVSPIALCRAILPQMIARRTGKIINLSGGGATSPRPMFTAYAVAKTGLVRFSETLAKELKEYPISVNCIAPGAMNTDMLNQVIEAGADMIGPAEHARALKTAQEGDQMLQRAVELCLFLASSKSDGISGKLISAAWDPWQELPDYLDEICNSDIYTLRRITPTDRGKSWGDVK